MVIEVCSAFGVSWWLWNFSMCMELFHASRTFQCFRISFIIMKLFRAHRAFLCKWKFSLVMKLFNACETFQCWWKSSRPIELFHVCARFPCLWNFYMFLELSHTQVIFFSLFMELFLHACESFSCSYNFSIFTECFNAYGTFSFPCFFRFWCFSILMELLTIFIVANYVWRHSLKLPIGCCCFYPWIYLA